MSEPRMGLRVAGNGCARAADWHSHGTSKVLLLALLREVRESRARILAVADHERRRIECDLHDGAQQRLIALMVGLELAADRLDDSDGDTAALLRGLGAEADAALEEIRSLVRGVYPAVLRDHGLAAALRSVALNGPIPITIRAEIGRYSPELEAAAYFCCLEAIQNASRHAHLATGIEVMVLEGNATLVIEVRDDGHGFDPKRTAYRSGLVNMRDRLAALDGDLQVLSSPGAGTRVFATIPLNSPPDPASATLPSVWAQPPVASGCPVPQDRTRALTELRAVGTACA